MNDEISKEILQIKEDICEIANRIKALVNKIDWENSKEEEEMLINYLE